MDFMQTTEEFFIKTGLSTANLTPQSHTTALKLTDEQELLLSNRLISHHPKAGINPLVDAAAYLFSLIGGKLKQLQGSQNLEDLQKNLIDEINQFQHIVTTKGYNADYVLASRYALCATLDDIISHTTWGHLQWDPHNLCATFNNSDSPTPAYEQFFIILERIFKEPSAYLDLMEFMFICLSLGFKGLYRNGNYHQLEEINDALYKHIRAQQVNFNKALSPFPFKVAPFIPPPATKKIALKVLVTSSIALLAIFIALNFILDSISTQTDQELITIGKTTLHETSLPT
jgi:type VI secretion system protein ImpK